MKTKKELEQQVKILQQELVDKKITKHTKAHIPLPNLLALIGTILSGLLCWGWFIVLESLWVHLDIGSIMNSIPLTEVYAYQFGIIPTVILMYVLVGLFVVSVVALFKGGYDKLKSYNEDGLLFGLLFGLLVGLLCGLLCGLLGGLLCGLLGGLLYGLLVGLLCGLLLEYDRI